MTSGWRRLVTAALLALAVVAAIGAAAAARLPVPPGWGTAAVAGVALAAGLLLDPAKKAAGEWIEQPRARRRALEAHLRMRDRRGRPQRVRDCADAVALGVHPATSEDTGGPPPYVRRDAEEALREAFGRGGLVVVEGRSAAGKSRLAYEAMRAYAPDRRLIVPETPQALRELRRAGVRLRDAVVWLDDVDRHLAAGGLDGGVLDALCPPGRTDVLLLATLRTEARRDLGDHDVLDRARRVTLPRDLGTAERERAERWRADPRIAAALDQDLGFAEYLAAGPAALDRWRSARDGEHPVAGAIVSAAVDARRAGLTAVPRALLAELHEEYLEPRDRARRERLPDFQAGLAWATEPVRGASACLDPVGGDRYAPFDYLTDDAQRAGSLRDVPDATWHAALAYAGPDDLTAVALAAYRAGRQGLSETGYRLAAEAGRLDAMNLLGLLLEEMGRPGEAAEWFHRAAHAGHAAAMVNLGNEARRAGRYDDAGRWYRSAVDAGHTAALHNLAVLARRAGRDDEAEEWSRRAAEAGHTAAMHDLAILLRRAGRTPEAEAWWRRAAETGHADAMRGLAALLYDDGRTQEAAAWWEAAAGVAGGATAANNLGDLLRQAGRTQEAEARYRLAADAGDVTAMRNLGSLLTETGRADEGARWLRRAAET